MSFEEALKTISVQASADLSADQYKFVTIEATGGQLELVGTLGANFVGILQDKPAAAGRPGSVGVDGSTKVLSGATIAVGDEISSSALGVAVVALTGHYVLGIAREAAVTGDIFSVQIDKYQKN